MKRILLSSLFVALSTIGFGATFTSNVAAGSWNAIGSWSVVGFDGDGIPDSDDDVTISNTHNISLAGLSNCHNLDIVSGGTLTYNSQQLLIYGDFTRSGTTIGTGTLYFHGNPATISIVNIYANPGNWYFRNGSNTTISATSTINKINYFYIQGNAVLTNNGVINLVGGSLTTTSTSSYVAGVNSTLLIARPLTGTNYNFSALGNTVKYSTGFTPNILNTTYHHLQCVTTTGTKTWSGGTLTVNGDLLISANTTLNFANQNLNLGGSWSNTANISCTNMGTVSFTGSGVQTISRSNNGREFFNGIDLNGTGTVLLGDSLIINGPLNINSGTLDVSASNYNIHVRGDFVDNGTFNARAGTVFFDGAVGQNIDGGSTTTFYNITASTPGGVTVNFTKQMLNLLLITNGTFQTGIFGGQFILLATGPTTYARIGPITSGGIAGAGWVIQAYVNGPATAYWQYITSPVSGNTVNDWDSDTRFYMSGVGGNDGNACCPVFFSLRTYNTATNTYSNITSTGTALTNGRGYMVWMADNRTQLTGPLIYDSRGTPSFGTVNRAVTAGGAGAGYNLVGNPFACPIDFADVVAASSATLSPNFVILQENGTYVTNPNSGVIGPNQAFMCVASVSGNMTVTESCKNTTALPNFIREAAPSNTIRIKAGNEVSGIGEQTTVQINAGAASEYSVMEDLAYLESPYENATRIWSTAVDQTKMLYNVIGNTEDHLMIPLTVVAGNPGVQTLQFKGLTSVTEYNCAWLEDVATGARVSLNQVDTYTYEEDAIGGTRYFVLHLERNSDCTFDLQTTVASLEASTNVYVSSGSVFAEFEFAEEEQVQISMYDMSGRVIMGETYMNVSTERVLLETPDAHGIYLVRIVKGNEVTTKKFYY